MKVKIIGSKLNFWYRNHIGECFDVEEVENCNSIYKVLGSKDRWIYKKHCVMCEQ